MSEDTPKDPFLRAHSRGPGHFSVSGKYSPGSIRDQMIRATAIIHRAYQAQLIDNVKDLLVVGAGVAGVSAAIQAVALGVSTTLVEQQQTAFSKQAASSRIIDPTEYDWPALHWNVGKIPVGNDYQMPLSWERGLASIVAVKWSEALQEFYEQHYPVLDIAFRTLFKEATPNLKGRIVSKLENVDTGTEYEKESSMLLDCRGAGTERVSVGSFSSTEFWRDDLFNIPEFGLPTSTRVLISGGGDGALQDFLRVMIPGKTAREIYNSLPGEAHAFIEPHIWHAEDEARRSFIWNANSEQDCNVLSRLHQKHLDVAKQLLNDPKLGYRVNAALSNLISPWTEIDKVFLAFHCHHFHPCYALNRFLALLTDLYVQQQGNISRLLPNRRLIAVHSADEDHKCSNNALECCKFSHLTYFRHETCQSKGAHLNSERFDSIMIRHGLAGDLPYLSRQVLPYTLSWNIDYC